MEGCTNIERIPQKDHSSQICFNLEKWFQKRTFSNKFVQKGNIWQNCQNNKLIEKLKIY